MVSDSNAALDAGLWDGWQVPHNPPPSYAKRVLALLKHFAVWHTLYSLSSIVLARNLIFVRHRSSSEDYYFESHTGAFGLLGG